MLSYFYSTSHLPKWTEVELINVANAPSVPSLRSQKIELESFPFVSHLKTMSTAEQIIHEIAGLRPEKQSEVLEFVEFLKEKAKKEEEGIFRNTSLSSAMRGLEDEDELYSESDLIEKLG